MLLARATLCACHPPMGDPERSRAASISPVGSRPRMTSPAPPQARNGRRLADGAAEIAMEPSSPPHAPGCWACPEAVSCHPQCSPPGGYRPRNGPPLRGGSRRCRLGRRGPPASVRLVRRRAPFPPALDSAGRPVTRVERFTQAGSRLLLRSRASRRARRPTARSLRHKRASHGRRRQPHDKFSIGIFFLFGQGRPVKLSPSIA